MLRFRQAGCEGIQPVQQHPPLYGRKRTGRILSRRLCSYLFPHVGIDLPRVLRMPQLPEILSILLPETPNSNLQILNFRKDLQPLSFLESCRKGKASTLSQ